MVDLRDWIRDVLNQSDHSDKHPLEELSESDIDIEIKHLQTEIESIELKINKLESEFNARIEKAAQADGPDANRLKLEAKRVKQQYERLIREHRELLAELTALYGVREVKRRSTEELDIEELPTELRHQLTEAGIQNETQFHELYVDTQRSFNSGATAESHVSESIDNLVSAPTPTLSDDSIAEVNVKPISSDESSAEPEQTSLRDQLSPTPYTLWQFPKSDVFAYFYYFTDEIYTQDESKFTTLDDQLTLLGRNRGGLEVGIFDRDRMAEQVWQLIIRGLSIDNYPALVVADGPIGVEEIDDQTENFSPNDVEFAILENGIISDTILKDPDETRDFLNTLFDAARDNEIKRQMRHEKVLESLTVAKEEVKDLFTVN
ncbi:hypothetical protein [Haloarcula japonica]|uniref:Uncharacterized protein n=1 Tax=Haloarcula japonica (strain ATCC 49778 / DSM 6131 / JCM 7785 / NBRC 101032 / NCIMB 13157 / TR-1) TaxID=1227453 RepID=M0L1X3_HALJT|nr:hypothetical protein [Haloarcula japonica]EMA27541.1 hypothetical protein C444_18672 [Haloarcula japonica DSM 6131]